jgi:hypothetical protein
VSAHRISRRAEVVVVGVIALCAVLSIFGSSSNSALQPVGLAHDVNAESTALFCTGFAGSRTAVPASVRFFNTANEARSVDVTAATGHGDFLHYSFVVSANGQYDMTPTDFPGHSYYGLTAVVAGGGVSAAVHPDDTPSTMVPCVSQGASRWSFTGLSTQVGATAELTLLNSTSTPAVVNLSTLSTNGFSAPQSFQGIVVKAHGLVAVNLGTQIVNSRSVYLNVHAVRGFVVAAVAESWSFATKGDEVVAGSSAPTDKWWFPSMPTSNDVTAIVALADPTNTPTHVTVYVAIPGYSIAPFNVDLTAQSTTQFTLSPSSRVPDAGAAQVTVSASSPVTATLLTTTADSKVPWILVGAQPGIENVVSDTNSRRLASLSLMNPGSTTARVTVTVAQLSGSRSARTWNLSIAAHSVASRSDKSFLDLGLDSYFVVSSNQAVVVGASPSPVGDAVALAQNASGSR